VTAPDADYEFTSDWTTNRLVLWRPHVEPLRGRPVRVLELGCYEGRASVWFLQNVLTHPSATLTVVDTFLGSEESGAPPVEGMFERFQRNVQRTGAAVKVSILRSSTVHALAELLTEDPSENQFDLIYVDASHRADDVITDAVLSFRLLKPGGLLIFDDYEWERRPSPLDRPKIAIDAFMTIFQRSLSVVHVGYQVLLNKTIDPS
jgi:predicted O-methyltransferase YrrM